MVLNPDCVLQLPEELCKNTDAQAPPQTSYIRILGGRGYGLGLAFKSSPGDSKL